jgi:hypothetical protein
MITTMTMITTATITTMITTTTTTMITITTNVKDMVMVFVIKQTTMKAAVLMEGIAVVPMSTAQLLAKILVNCFHKW